MDLAFAWLLELGAWNFFGVWSLELGAYDACGIWTSEIVTTASFIFRSLRFHSRAHLGALLGAAVGSAVLIGALVVGDSVRLTLRDRALERLGQTQLALFSGDRFFTQSLGRRLGSPLGFASPAASTQTVSPDAIFLRGGQPVTTLLQLPGTATTEDDTARANRV